MTAPRLWGSESSSHTTIRGGSPFSRAAFRMSSTLAYSRTAARAMTPWWEWVRLMPSSLRRSALHHHDALVPGGGGDVAQGGVGLAPGEIDLVDGSAGPQGLHHGVAALR